jgi:hypothetical protein
MLGIEWAQTLTDTCRLLVHGDDSADAMPQTRIPKPFSQVLG